MDDQIYRQAAIDTEGLDEQIKCEMCRNPMHTVRGCDGNCKYDERLYERIMQILDKRIKPLPSAQPYLQQTCNQLATDTIYRQAAIDAVFKDDRNTTIKQRLEALPPAQPVHNTGKWVRGTYHGFGIYNWTCKCGHVVVAPVPDRFCGACGCDNAERRTDGFDR